MDISTYKSAGTIYRIDDTMVFPSGFQKRMFYLEIPAQSGSRQSTEIVGFTVLWGECDSLSYYELGEFVEVMFRVEGRFYKGKKDPDTEFHSNTLKVIDIHKRDNPFRGGEKISEDPDDNSPDHLAELAQNVKDYTQNNPTDNSFEPRDGDLPF